MIFDTSAIFYFIEREEWKKLVNGKTCSLVFYEIGNIIWKRVYLLKTFTEEEGIFLLKTILEFIKKEMKTEEVDFLETSYLSIKLGITFYDACYVYLAKKNNEALVTLDKELIEKVKKEIVVINAKDY